MNYKPLTNKILLDNSKNFWYNDLEKEARTMKILAIDASTHSTGYAIGQNGVLKKHGCITAASKDTVKRIIKMREQVSKLIKDHKIDKIIIEQVRPEYNSHTNKILMWLQGAIIIAAHEANPSIEEEYINAVTWRAALKMKQGPGIKRDPLKMQDIKYVQNKYNIKVNDDQADAICIFDAYWEKFDNQINWE